MPSTLVKVRLGLRAKPAEQIPPGHRDAAKGGQRALQVSVNARQLESSRMLGEAKGAHVS
eukprot:4838489-Alexandrium_andersonii.AAC.1